MTPAVGVTEGADLPQMAGVLLCGNYPGQLGRFTARAPAARPSPLLGIVFACRMRCPTALRRLQGAAPVWRVRGCFLARPANGSFLTPRRPFLARLRRQGGYNVMEHGKVIGRIYEQLHTPPDLRCFWTIVLFTLIPDLR